MSINFQYFKISPMGKMYEQFNSLGVEITHRIKKIWKYHFFKIKLMSA